MSAIHALLRDSIDYAGLFPPAGLGMSEAVANYASYRTGPHAWALGRFVVPAGRLVELEQAAVGLLPPSNGWRIAALLASDPIRELEAIGEFNCRHAAEGAGAAAVDVVEAKADSAEAAERLLARIPGYLQPYIEIPVSGDPAPLATAVGRAGGRLKVRTGGVTADAFPSATISPASSAPCVQRRRALQGDGRTCIILSAPSTGSPMSPAAPAAPMFGFLNLFLATAFVSAGMERCSRGAPAGGARPTGAPLRCRRHRVAGTEVLTSRPSAAPASPASSRSAPAPSPSRSLISSRWTALDRRGRHPRPLAPLLGRVGRSRDADFPLQNLPLGVFRRRGSDETARVGVAIGDMILDVDRVPRGASVHRAGGDGGRRLRGAGAESAHGDGARARARSCAGQVSELLSADSPAAACRPTPHSPGRGGAARCRP